MTNYLEKSITELHKLLKDKVVTSEELINEALDKAHQNQAKLNAFVTIIDEAKATPITDNMLSGLPYAAKDNLSTIGIVSTASSNTLKDYVPFYDATCITKLKAVGAINIGKTVMDELGMGGTGTTGHTGVVRNPWHQEHLTAGSSAGSAAAVAAGIVPFALGSDTGDSIRKPAAFCGIVGYKPTYGLVSRYGLFAFASSLDHVGCLTRSVQDAAIVIDNIKGYDEFDMTSLPNQEESLYEACTGEVKNNKLFYIKELIDLRNEADAPENLIKVMAEFDKTIAKCREIGIEVSEESFDIKLLNAIFPTYNCLSCAEATSNDSNLTGIIFGPRGSGNNINEVMTDHRTKGFSPLIKRRFVIGSYVLQKENQERYFLNAQRARRLIVDTMNKLFSKYDGLILPCSGGPAKLIVGSSNVLTKENEILENHMFIGNAGGFPSITIPNGFIDNLPIGINITGKVLDDANVLNIAFAIEKTMNFKNQVAKGGN